MRERCEEVVLAAVGLLQRMLVPLAIGDIEGDTDSARQSVLDRDCPAADEQPPHGIVGRPDDPELIRVVLSTVDVGLERQIDGASYRGVVFRKRQQQQRIKWNRLGTWRKAEQPALDFVEMTDALCRVQLPGAHAA